MESPKFSLKAYIFTTFKFKLIKITEENSSSSGFVEANNESGFEISKEMFIALCKNRQQGKRELFILNSILVSVMKK